MVYSEPAPAKLNLALHVRGRMPDGRHRIETLFAFCVDGDVLHAEPSDGVSLDVTGPFAGSLAGEGENLVERAARRLAEHSDAGSGAALTLVKNLPVASGIGGGSADAAAALRLLTRLWRIDPAHAEAVAPGLGADVPACLLSMTARGEGVGERLQMVGGEGISGTPVLLVNPGVAVGTGDVFARWDGVDRGPLEDWRDGRNDLEAAALEIAPQIGGVLDWLHGQQGARFVRMSGSGATCFALFDGEADRDRAETCCPAGWWRLATFLR